MHRRGDLAAVVQQPGDLQLVAVRLAHGEIGERSFLDARGCLREHHGQLGHPFAVAAGVGRFLVQRGVDQLDQGFEQLGHLLEQAAVVERNRRLRRERFDQFLVGVGEHTHAGVRAAGVDQLQHADHFADVVLHRHRQEGLRAVSGAGVESPRTGKIEARLAVGIAHVDGVAGQRRVRHHQRVVGAAVRVMQGYLRQVDGLARAAALVQPEGQVAQQVEGQTILADAIEGHAVGLGEGARRFDDALHQAVEVAGRGQGLADLVERLEADADLVVVGHASPSRRSCGPVRPRLPQPPRAMP